MIVGIGLLGLVVMLGAHVMCRVAERRAREAYRELVGEEAAAQAAEDAWQDIRPLVGGWGCVLPLMEFARGLGLLLLAGAVIYLIAAP